MTLKLREVELTFSFEVHKLSEANPLDLNNLMLDIFETGNLLKSTGVSNSISVIFALTCDKFLLGLQIHNYPANYDLLLFVIVCRDKESVAVHILFVVLF